MRAGRAFVVNTKPKHDTIMKTNDDICQDEINQAWGMFQDYGHKMNRDSFNETMEALGIKGRFTHDGLHIWEGLDSSGLGKILLVSQAMKDEINKFA